MSLAIISGDEYHIIIGVTDDVKVIKSDLCSDGKKNQDETDVDCGGICGATCDDNEACKVMADCVHGYCTRGLVCGTFRSRSC